MTVTMEKLWEAYSPPHEEGNQRFFPANSHINDSAVLDRERRPDNSAPVHEFSIHEDKIDILCSLYKPGRNLRYCT